jgi:hypothetical protein
LGTRVPQRVASTQLVGSSAVSSSSRLAAKIFQAPTPRRTSNVSPISWAPVVFAPAHSLVSTSMSLWSALEGKKTDELCYELLGMASTQLEEAV